MFVGHPKQITYADFSLKTSLINSTSNASNCSRRFLIRSDVVAISVAIENYSFNIEILDYSMMIPLPVSITDSSFVLFIAVVILIFFVVLYWLRIWLFLLDHGSNVSVIDDDESTFESLFDVIAAVNRRDNGSTSESSSFDESGSNDDDDVCVEGVCGLLV